MRAIESIRKQTVTDFEFLIIDDGSEDDSWKIIKQFAKRDNRIRKFRNRRNMGLVKSLNLLIPKTKGRFIARMDADDISLSTRFEKQIAFLSARPELVACGGQEHIINERGRIIAEKFFPTDEKTCYNMIANIMVIQPPLLMARAEVFRKLRYSNHMFKNDDITMHFKLLEHGGFSNVDDIIFKYRKRETSLTHKDPKHVFYLALVVRLNAIKNHNYAPPVINLFLMGAEAIVVSVLPNRAIVALFEMIRHTKIHRDRILTKLQYFLSPA